MRRIIILALVALTGLTSVAAADRGGRFRDHRGDHRSDHRRWSGWDNHRSHRVDRQRHVRHDHVRVVRRPIYVQRPVIRYRYVDYNVQPRVIVENHPPIAGYYWVAGTWFWTGYEWKWNPGHYEPDPNYVDPSYSSYTDPGYSTYDGY
jgi:hypothetical protein